MYHEEFISALLIIIIGQIYIKINQYRLIYVQKIFPLRKSEIYFLWKKSFLFNKLKHSPRSRLSNFFRLNGLYEDFIGESDVEASVGVNNYVSF